MASGVRGKELHTSLVPDKEVVVPVTVGLPVAGTRSCTNQDKKSMKITLNIYWNQWMNAYHDKKKHRFEIAD